jgi:carbonic anhydrase
VDSVPIQFFYSECAMKIRHGLFAVGFTVLLLQLNLGCASQKSASGDEVASGTPLQQLIAGNDRFAKAHPLHLHQDVDRRTEVAGGQRPMAIVVGCSDSRVPPEIVFDQGLGDIFVVRVAGEVVDDQALGSIEYAVEHLHAHLIVVMGHEKCGAVQAAVDGGEVPGHIGSIVQSIKPAVEKARQEPGDVLDNAINENVLHIVDQIKTSEPILSHAVKADGLVVVGARYNLARGTVQWLSQP